MKNLDNAVDDVIDMIVDNLEVILTTRLKSEL